MLKNRVIPCLQLIDESLVKTVKFTNHTYIGDPVNTVRIFNELEVDELCFLDIRASVQHRKPNIELLHQIDDECFMPLAYGGGINSFDIAKEILSIGFEKVIINTAAYKTPALVTEIAGHFGVQAVIGSIDVKKNIWGKWQVYVNDGTEKIPLDPVEWAQALEQKGAGELLVTSIDREGTWQGYDLDIISKISRAVTVPVIANGGAGTIAHLGEAIHTGGASAVAVGSMVVFQKKGMGVLVNFPEKAILEEAVN